MDTPPRNDPPNADTRTQHSYAGATRSGARIAYFSESVLPWVDGVSRTLGEVFDALEVRRREFRIYTPIAPSGDYAWSHRVHHMPSAPLMLHRDYRVSLPDRQKLTSDLDAFQPDLVHVCNPTPASIWAQSYARSRGIPVVGSLHTHFVAYFRYYYASLFSWPAWRYLRWFYNRCDVTLAPSTSTIREMEANGIRNGRLWSRGIDCERFSPVHRDEALRQELGVKDNVPLLLLVSRLVKEKDLADLPGMHRILKQRGLEYRFAIVGKGGYANRLKRAMPDAIFPGQQVGQDLSRWYASADVFVFPSTTEAFGNVVQEAMASGLATVVVDAGGPPGILEAGAGGLVAQPNKPSDLADKVERLIRDRALRQSFGIAAREHVRDRTWDLINEQLLADYEDVVQAHRVRTPNFRRLQGATA